MPRPAGFNVVSYVSGNLGVGVTARNFVELLIRKGVPVALLDLDPGRGRARAEPRFDRYCVGSADDLPYPVNLLILPPVALAHGIPGLEPLLTRPGCVNVALSMWELPVLPGWAREALGVFDLLVAESDFLRDAFARNLPGARVVSAAHPLYLPADVRGNRARFRLPEDAVVFACSFEPYSDPVRKNPYGVIEAYRAAFGPGVGTCLAVRVNNATMDGREHPALADLRALCADDPRVRLLVEPMAYPEVLSLYASADVYVSLHRAEGLGLGMAEAMMLGKPVIATAWSGNTTFMQEGSSCLIDFELVPVSGSNGLYTPQMLGGQARWAEPDLAHASAWMRRLVESPALRRAIGARAAADLRVFHARAEQADFVEAIRSVLAGRESLTKSAAERRDGIGLLRARTARPSPSGHGRTAQAQR